MRREKGAVAVFFAITASILIGFLALAFDVARMYDEQRQIQFVADAASLSAAKSLMTIGLWGSSNSSVANSTAKSVALSNGVSASEIDSAGGVEVGNWNTGTKVFAANTSPYNAVRVRIKRDVQMSFAAMFGTKTMQPDVVSIALAPQPEITGRCVKPFGLEGDALNSPVTIEPGNTFWVGKAEAGNWGKVEVSGDLNGGQDFINSMLSDDCGSNVVKGDPINVETGYAGIDEAFTTLLNPQYANLRTFVVPITVEDFPNGKSVKTMHIAKFAKVEFVQSSGSGNGWSGQFILKELLEEAPYGYEYAPGSDKRLLVK